MSKKNSTCFETPSVSDQEHAALKALYAGNADTYQQRLALHLIVNSFSRAHDILYVPGSFDQSAFMAGRAFVGQRILRYLNLPVGKLKQGEDNAEEV